MGGGAAGTAIQESSQSVVNAIAYNIKKGQLSEEDFQILYKAVRNDSYEFKDANYSLRVAMCHCKEDREVVFNV